MDTSYNIVTTPNITDELMFSICQQMESANIDHGAYAFLENITIDQQKQVAIIVLDQNKFVAAIISSSLGLKTSKTCWNIGSIVVMPEYRHKGLAKKLIYDILKMVPSHVTEFVIFPEGDGISFWNHLLNNKIRWNPVTVREAYKCFYVDRDILLNSKPNKLIV